MAQRQSRRFEADGVSWIARLQEPGESDSSSRSPTSEPEPGIWFEDTAGKCRFLRLESDELPAANEFRVLSGLELSRMLRRAIDK